MRFSFPQVIPVLAAVILLSAGCQEPHKARIEQEQADSLLSDLKAAAGESNSVTEELSGGPPNEIARFCGDCHVLPTPDLYERKDWYDKVRKGFEFYARSGRVDLEVPTVKAVVSYYQANAPESIEFAEPPKVDGSWVGRFKTTKLDWRDTEYVTPAVSAIRWLPLFDDESVLVVSDMRDGGVNIVAPDIDPQRVKRALLTRLGSPARVDMADLNGDGMNDLVIAELGSFNPYEHGYGKVVSLLQDPGRSFQSQTLVTQVGRVADVAVGDFDRDLLPDIAVAEFGHRQSGGIRVLSGVEFGDDGPSFQEQLISDRPGTVRLLRGDWNQDNVQDLACLVSQEYESVELMYGVVGATKPTFRRTPICGGNPLSYGSVGLEMVDLDKDGDDDFLFTHGDCFDNNYADRSHGVDWLENLGNGRFKIHPLLRLLGAYQAKAGDFDGDGDVDVVVAANRPGRVEPASAQQISAVSLVMLEQIGEMEFATRVLEEGTPRYAALEVGDFNSDGKPDFVVGAQLFGTDPPGSSAAKLPRLTVWWNQ